MFTEFHREEKREDGESGEQEKKGGNQKERDGSRPYSVPSEFSTAQNTHRDSHCWVEKKRGREEIEVTWGRKMRVKRGRG